MALVSANPVRAEAGNASPAARDTLIENCELYLFGRFVEPISRGGKRGYVVQRTLGEVAINDVIYVSLSSFQEIAALDRDAANPKLRTFQRVAEQVRNSITFTSTGGVLVDGKTVVTNEVLPYSTGEDGSPVSIEFGKTGFTLYYRDTPMFFRYSPRPAPTPLSAAAQEDHNQLRLDESYDEIVRALVPNSVVVLGRSYVSVYRNPKRHDNLRKALSLIPARAESYAKADGTSAFRPLTINGFQFSSTVVRDFASAGAER